MPLRLIGSLVALVIRGLIRFVICTLAVMAFIWLEPLYIDSTIVRTLPSTLIVGVIMGAFQAIGKPVFSFLPTWVFGIVFFALNLLLIVTCSNLFGTFEITKLAEISGLALIMTLLSILI